MGLKMEVVCSRCKKTRTKAVDSVAEAQAFEALEKARHGRLEEIAAFFAKLPAEELPALVVIRNGGVEVAHMTLCDQEDADDKRSCTKRVGELVAETDELKPRKQRASKKVDAVEVPEEKTPAPTTEAIQLTEEVK